MDLALRLASEDIDYPLALSGRADWQRSTDGWRAQMTIRNLPTDHIVVPSYSTLAGATRYQFHLQAGKECSTLHPVPAAADEKPSNRAQKISAHIDCWHTNEAVEEAVVVLDVHSESEPRQYLWCVSARPLQIEPPPSPAEEVCAPAPEPISQMEADKTIAKRICSPTAMAMALRVGSASDWQATVEACYDPLTRAYGAWPLAIRAANAAGRVASVESNASWESAITLLRNGMPVVCSIRFKKGELQGAPLASTSGHLVCLYGVADGKALVMDPAAASQDSVPHAYDIEEFSRAWLTHRGAAYFLGNGETS
jgi:hypothetical protein